MCDSNYKVIVVIKCYVVVIRIVNIRNTLLGNRKLHGAIPGYQIAITTSPS